MSIKYTKRLAEAGIEPSVGSAGDSYDNAYCRLLEPIGNIPPAEPEELYYAATDNIDMAA